MSSKCGRICAMYGCSNYGNQKERKSFFRMPREKERLVKWIAATKRKDLDELLKVKEPDYFCRTYCVCSDHFDVQCFKNKNLYSQGLHPWSIPTLNLYNVSNVKKRKNRDGTSNSDITSKIGGKKKVKVAREASENEIIDPQEIEVVLINNHLENTVSVSSLLEENSNLKFLLSQHERRFNTKAALVLKYRKQIVSLKQKLLQSENVKRSSKNQINIPVDDQEAEDNNDIEGDDYFAEDALVENSEEQIDLESQREQSQTKMFITPANAKKRTFTAFETIDSAIKKLSKISEDIKTEQENEFSVFCKSLALQLQNMPLDRALICQQRLQNVMTEERMYQCKMKQHQVQVDGRSPSGSPYTSPHKEQSRSLRKKTKKTSL